MKKLKLASVLLIIIYPSIINNAKSQDYDELEIELEEYQQDEVDYQEWEPSENTPWAKALDKFTKTENSTPNSSSILSGHYYEFKKQAESRGVDIKTDKRLVITVRDGLAEDEGDFGLCTWKEFEILVEIDQTFFDTHSYQYVEALIFHELGHATLNRHHDNSLSPHGIAYSIMNARMSTYVQYYSDHREYYLNELFKNI